MRKDKGSLLAGSKKKNFRQIKKRPRQVLLPPLQQRKQKPPFRPVHILLLIGLSAAISWLVLSSPEDEKARVPETREPPNQEVSWQRLSTLLAQRLDSLNGSGCLEVQAEDEPVMSLYTGLDMKYQKWVEKRLSRSMALAAVAVALDPLSGRILALATYNQDSSRPEAFFWKAYPAASLFKVVTAAAALESARLNPDSVLTYTGRAHTLYRRDLKDKTYRWSNRVSLEKAFARSINSVFGKIGIHKLGRPLLLETGTAFFFNLPLPCEIPMETSLLNIPEEDYGIAEIASGFNRKTLLSPVHAAWIAGVVAAGGTSPTPWLVERIQGGKIPLTSLLHHQTVPIRVLPPVAAEKLKQLMEATIRYGTCYKSFAKRKRYRCLRSLVFGGKTGNVNNREDSLKYDWFVGYARDPADGRDLALSVLMFHGRMLGHRANVMAFDLFKHYFCRK